MLESLLIKKRLFWYTVILLSLYLPTQFLGFNISFFHQVVIISVPLGISLSYSDLERARRKTNNDKDADQSEGDFDFLKGYPLPMKFFNGLIGLYMFILVYNVVKSPSKLMLIDSEWHHLFGLFFSTIFVEIWSMTLLSMYTKRYKSLLSLIK